MRAATQGQDRFIDTRREANVGRDVPRLDRDTARARDAATQAQQRGVLRHPLFAPGLFTTDAVHDARRGGTWPEGKRCVPLA